MILCVTALSLFSGKLNVLNAKSFYDWFDISGLGFIDDELIEYKMSSYEERERVILWYGVEGGEVEKWRPLYELDPDNPVYFFPYFSQQLNINGDLPPEDWETIKEKDSDNGIYDLMKIHHGFDEKYPINEGRNKLPEEERKKAPTLKITDQEAFKKDLEHLRNALKKGGLLCRLFIIA